MDSKVNEELRTFKNHLRRRLLKYTRQAFEKLPEQSSPRILDVGCSSGVPTLELARLSQGKVIGIDIDQTSLDRLDRKIRYSGRADRVKTVNCFIIDMNFADFSFDIIWAEGSIAVIGFEKGLKDWYRFLKPEGFLVVHDDLGNLKEKLRQTKICGYELVDYFLVDENVWLLEYYTPLEKRLDEIRMSSGGNKKIIAGLNDDLREVQAIKRMPERYRSIFFIMRKT
jgi:ubiquinone/menaquinone biosynthesis C-methylase UbiE